MFFLIGNSKQRLFNQLIESQAEVASLELDLGKTREDSAALSARLHQLDADLGATKNTLDETQFAHDKLSAALELAEADRTQSIADSAQARTELREAQTKLVQIRAKTAGSISPQQAMRYRQIIVELESKVGEMENDLAQIKNTAQPEFISSRAYHAQTVRVGPRNAFVVINYGKSHGALPNQRFEIKRGLDVLAMVEISDLTENYSVAQVLPETLSGNLRKGDAAIITP